MAKLFADDTTLYKAGNDIDKLISSFIKDLEPLISWCEMNRFDINFKKTFCLIATRHRVVIPKSIILNGVNKEVVSKFKLLGVTLDKKYILTFLQYVVELMVHFIV